MLQSAAIRFSRAEVEAITDGLTGLYNHRYLHERLEEELERARRRASTLSLLFCDCDQFKIYNDDYGHKAGDAALARVARIIEANSRRTDLAARYGGEEFVLALVDTDAAGAHAVAEAIRAEVESVSARHGRPLTVSIGIATSPDDATRAGRATRQGRLGDVLRPNAPAQPCARLRRRSRADQTWLSRRGR